jgi:hypothetical protein
MISTTVFAQEAAPTPPPAEPTVAAAPAEGGTVAVVDRGLVMAPGTGEAGLDLSFGMDKSAMFKRIHIAGSNLAARYVEGLYFKYGIIENLEAGLALNALNYTKVGGKSDTKFGGGTLYGRYAIMPMLGVDLGIYFPGEKFGDNRVALQLGIPFQYVVMPGQLKVHAALDVWFNLAKQADKTNQFHLLVPIGGTFNATPELFFDLTFQADMMLKPSDGSMGDRTCIPLSLTAGYTVMPALDVYLAFELLNLKPKTGNAFDSKQLGLGAAYRF